MSPKWITFDCYGTLLDWQTAFRRTFEPVVGERADDLVKAFHAVEPEVERDLPTASYKAILREGVARAAQRAGVEVDTELARRELAHDRGVPGHGRRACGRSATTASSSAS